MRQQFQFKGISVTIYRHAYSAIHQNAQSLTRGSILIVHVSNVRKTFAACRTNATSFTACFEEIPIMLIAVWGQEEVRRYEGITIIVHVLFLDMENFPFKIHARASLVPIKIVTVHTSFSVCRNQDYGKPYLKKKKKTYQICQVGSNLLKIKIYPRTLCFKRLGL